jgi:hypothetical protein
MSTLTGTKIKDTYQSLLKLSSNGSLDPYFSTVISDGLGNNTALMLSGSSIDTQIPATSVPYGLSLQLFNNGNISIGDYSNQFNGTWIGMNDFTELIGTYSNNLAKGLKLDFPNGLYQFGDFNSIDNGNSFWIDDASNLIRTYSGGQRNGLQFDFGAKEYSLGDFDTINNGTAIFIEDNNENITLRANNFITFQGGSLQDNNPRTYSGKNIVVKNPSGNTYYLPLYQ